MRRVTAVAVAFLCLAPASTEPPSVEFVDEPGPGLSGGHGNDAEARKESGRSPDDEGSSYVYTEERIRDYFLDEACGVDMVLGRVEVWLITGPPYTESFQHSVVDCVPAPWPPGDPPPGVDPFGPAAAQAVIHELLPVPEVTLSPDAHGITGFEVWLWHDEDPSLEPIDHDGDPSTPAKPGLTVTATDGPYSISATVWIDRFAWDMGDGTTATATESGSRGDPAATHTYATSDPDYTVTAHAIWTGRYSWSSPLASGSDLDMGELDVASAPRPYPVREVHAVPADN